MFLMPLCDFAAGWLAAGYAAALGAGHACPPGWLAAAEQGDERHSCPAWRRSILLLRVGIGCLNLSTLDIRGNEIPFL